MEQSSIYLRRVGTNEDVDAELWDDITDLHLDMWRSTWVPVIEKTVRRLRSESAPREKWPQDLHWNWDKKTDWSRSLLTLQRFAITSRAALQGLMLVNLTKLTARLPSQRGKDLAYIEFVSTAPWNRKDFGVHPEYSGVGANMIRAAIELSRNEGFHGRVGLHSLNQADRFYKETCGMSELGPDDHYDGLNYFEMTRTQADAFCRTL